MMNRELWLDPIPDSLRADAVSALERGDYLGFLIKAANTSSLELVYFNALVLQELGVYEPALLDAFSATRTNNHRWPLRELKAMFELADRERLRAAGSPLPSPGPYTLYRGVAGRGNRTAGAWAFVDLFFRPGCVVRSPHGEPAA